MEDAGQATMAFLLRLRARGVADVDLLRAIETVPRHLFVPYRYADLAFREMDLPIACGQTIPDPFALARSIEALRVTATCRVLEIGTGSGYGTAILARLASGVVSLERYNSLFVEAGARLGQLGIANVSLHQADGLAAGGTFGLFDRILVHAALDEFPPLLVEALAVGGIIVAGRSAGPGAARLTRLAHREDGRFEETDLGVCRLSRPETGLPQAL